MKKSILSLAMGMLVLMSVPTLSSFEIKTTPAKKGNTHWVVNPCFTGSTVTGKIAGLGNGDITITVQGQFSCTNPGTQDPPSWQDFTRTKTDHVAKNGTYSLSNDLKLCPNGNWVTHLQNLTVTISQGGAVVLGPTACPSCQ